MHRLLHMPRRPLLVGVGLIVLLASVLSIGSLVRVSSIAGQPTAPTAAAPLAKLSPDIIQRAKHALDYLATFHLTRPQAAGIVGSLIYESALNPAAAPPRAPGYGIAQWPAYSVGWTGLLDFSHRDPYRRPAQNLDLQLDFLYWHLHEPENASCLTVLKASQDAAQAVTAFTYGYLRAAPANLEQRTDLAEAIALL